MKNSSLQQSLLIEPFGIETKGVFSFDSLNVWLLIEPFGIETFNRVFIDDETELLIEPFGIETKVGLHVL